MTLGDTLVGLELPPGYIHAGFLFLNVAAPSSSMVTALL
jgi:hypothetical protein